MKSRVKQLAVTFASLMVIISLQCLADNRSSPESEHVEQEAEAVAVDQIAMVSTLYKHAVDEVDTGNVSEANQLLEEILDKDPAHHNARLQRGRLLIQAGAPEQAMAILSPLLVDGEAGWEPWFWMGTASLMSGHLAKASAYLDTALSYNSQIADIWLQRAVLAQEKGNLEGALQLLQMAIELSPGSPLVWLNFAYVNNQKGDKNTAITAYRQFLKLSANKRGYNEQRKAVVSILLNVD